MYAFLPEQGMCGWKTGHEQRRTSLYALEGHLFNPEEDEAPMELRRSGCCAKNVNGGNLSTFEDRSQAQMRSAVSGIGSRLGCQSPLHLLCSSCLCPLLQT